MILPVPTRRRRGRSTPAPAALDQQHRHGDTPPPEAKSTEAIRPWRRTIKPPRTDDHTGTQAHGGDHGSRGQKLAQLEV
jgi:hypothetical protein